MNKLHARCLTLLTALALAVPLVAAGHGAYEYHGRLEGQSVAYLLAPTDRFFIHDVAEGSRITASLDWSDARVDMDLAIRQHHDCAFTSTAPECVNGNLYYHADCRVESNNPPLMTEEALTVTAWDAGTYAVHVRNSFATPVVSVAYHLVVQVDGAHGRIDGPSQITYITPGSPNCRALGLVQ